MISDPNHCMCTGKHSGIHGERRADRDVPEDDARDGTEEDRDVVNASECLRRSWGARLE